MTRSGVTDFEAHRSFLAGLAYRMLGSLAEADDVVQDAYLRWADVDRSAIAHPQAYLARVVTRLCLDRMKSATSRREQYVGTWLPEPIVAAPEDVLVKVHACGITPTELDWPIWADRAGHKRDALIPAQEKKVAGKIILQP